MKDVRLRAIGITCLCLGALAFPVDGVFAQTSSPAGETAKDSAGTGQATGGTNDAATRSFYSANGLLNRGLNELAVEEYRSFLKDHGDHASAPVARYGLGVALFRLNKFHEAATELAPLAEADDFTFAAEVQVLLGQSHLALGDAAQASGHFKLVIAQHEGHQLADDAAGLLAEADYLRGKYSESKEASARLESRWPESPRRERAELFAGMSEMALGEYQPAAQRFERLQSAAAKDSPLADQINLLLAQSLHRLNLLDRARAEYQRVIEHAGEAHIPAALYGLAALLHQQGQPESAGKIIDTLLKKYPNDNSRTRAELLRARAHFDLEAYDEAKKLLQSLAGRDLGELADDVDYWLAKSDLRLEKFDDAADALSRAVEKHPHSDLQPEMTYDAAVALHRAGRTDDALAMLNRFNAQFTQHTLAPAALQLTGSLQHECGNYDDSLATAESFLDRSPNHALTPTVQFLRAENLFLLHQDEPAATAYRAFLDAYPDDDRRTTAMYRLGLAHYRLTHYDEAEPWLAQVVEAAQKNEAFAPALLAYGDMLFQRGEWQNAILRFQQFLAHGDDQSGADDALLKLGIAYQRIGELDAAIAQFDRLLEVHPDSSRALHARFERGQALVKADRLNEAKQAMQSVLEAGKQTRFAPHALNHFGSIAMQEDEYASAAAYFGQVAEIAGDEAIASEAIFQQGRALLAAGQHQDAAKSFARLLSEYEASDRRPAGAANLAIALSRQGRHQDALLQIDAVESEYAEADPPLPPLLLEAVRYEKAWCLRGLKRPVEAIEVYRTILTSPQDERLRRSSWVELAELEMDREQYKAAAQPLDAFLENVSAKEAERDENLAALREQALYRRGVCAFRSEEFRPAAALLERMISEYPKSDLRPSAELLAGESRFRTGEHGEAIEHLQRASRQEHDALARGPALLRLGEAHAALQQWKKSEDAFRVYLEDFRESDQWYQAEFGVGWAKENQNQSADAIAHYRIVVQRHQGPTAARAQFQIGECLFAQKQLDEAARELLKVDILYAYPEWSAAALYEAGRCFEEMSNPVDARKQFEAVVRDHGETEWAQLAAARLEALAQVTLPGR